MPPIATKKAAPVYPEIPLEPIQASAIVVIHPGSMYLRIGRASDAFPHTIPHVIARQAKSPGPAHEDPFLIPTIKMDTETSTAMKETELTVSSVLASCLTSQGRMRYPTQPEKASEYNAFVKPEILNGCTDLHWTKVPPSLDFIIGEEVLYLHPEMNFHINWPIRRGQFNIHNGIGGSLMNVLTDLETIWATAIQQLLDIPLKDLKHYRAVLVVPDVYNRQHVKEMVNLILIKLGFGGCFIHLESVCASFGAGLSYACVVDVGDQKTSVSCVEDGISHRSTRLCMEYGGSDVTQLFHWLLKKSGFPYQACNPSLSKLDAILLQGLKENFCHVNLDVCGVQDRTFQVKHPESHIEQYYIKVGDECIIAPLGLFHPELFGLTGQKKIHTLQRYMGDPDDPYDENFLIQTQRRGARENIEGTQSSDLGPQGEDGQLVQGIADEEDAADAAQAIGPRETEKDIQVDQLLGIDQAILQSIEQCDSDDLKRKMYGCILLVGGGILFPGIHTWLQNRLSVQIPIMYRGEPIDIVTRPKDMDPRITTWKGAAVMSCLDTAQELWINKKEWQRFGVKVLRERAPFFW